MADGGGVTIDSLQIEVEATSSEAAAQVSSLAGALRELKSALDALGNANQIPDMIRNIGKSASSAFESISGQKMPKPKKDLQDIFDSTGGEKNIPVIQYDQDGIEHLENQSEKIEHVINETQNIINQIGAGIKKAPEIPSPQIGMPSFTGDAQLDKFNFNKEQAKVKTEITEQKVLDLKERLQELSQQPGLGPEFANSLNTAIKKLQDFDNAVKAVRESYERIEDTFNNPREINTKNLREVITAYRAAQAAANTYGQAAVDAANRAEKESKNKFQPPQDVLTKALGRDLYTLDTSAEKSSNTLSDLQSRLEAIRNIRGLGDEFSSSLDAISSRLNEFKTNADIAKASAEKIKSVLEQVGAGSSIDLSNEQLRSLIASYKEAKAYASAYEKSASDAIKRVESELKKLDTATPEDVLAKALGKDSLKIDSTIAKTDDKISDLQRRLNILQNTKGIGDEFRSSLESINEKLNDFRAKADVAKSGADMIRDALSQISAGNLELTNQQLRELVSAYKDAQVAAKEAGNVATSAMGNAEKSARQEAQAFKQFLSEVQKSVSGSTLKGLDSEFSKLQKKLDTLTKPSGISSIDLPEISKASSDMEKFQNAIRYAKEQSDILKNAIEEVKKGTTEIPIEVIRNMEKAYKDAAKAAQEAGEAAKKSVSGAEQKVGDISSQLSSVKGAFGDISKVMSAGDMGPALSKIFGAAEGEIISMIGSSEALSGALSGVAAAAPEVAVAFAAIKVAVEATKIAFNVLYTVVIGFYKAVYTFLKPAIDVAVEGIKKLSAGFKEVSIGAAKGFVKGIKIIAKSLGSYFTKPFRNAISFIDKWKKSLGRVAFYRAVRSAIKAVTDGFKTGIENLYQYSRLVGTEFAPSMDKLATSALYLKNSFGAMAAPLINALAPVIDMLVDKFVALLNIIGKVFATLTGKSVYTQAKKHVVDYADATGKASKATKDFMLGIDELNVISKDMGSAASGMEDYGDMFEEVEIDQDEFDWAKQIREAIENGEWKKVGEILGEKLNQIIDDWDSVGWGEWLGDKINKGIDIASGFLDTFRFEEFGQKLAGWFNGLASTLHWDELGALLGKWYNGLLDGIIGFSGEFGLHWAEIGQGIADFINGFIAELDPSKVSTAINTFFLGVFTLLQTALEGIHWFELGTKLGEILNGIDWFNLVYNALILIKDAINAVKITIDGVLDTWDFMKTADEIAAAINEAFADEAFWKNLGTSIGNAIKAALAFISELVSEIQWVTIGRDIGQLLIGLDWPGMFDGLADMVAAGINAAIDLVKGLLDIITPNIQSIGEDIVSRIKQFFETDIDWADLAQTISNGITTALSFISTLLNPDMFYSIGSAIGNLLVNLDWPGMFDGLAEALLNGINSAISLANGLFDQLEPNIEQIATDLATSINDFLEKVDWDELAETINRGIELALNFLETLLDKIEWDKVGEAIYALLVKIRWNEHFSNLGDIILGAIGDILLGWIQAGWANIGDIGKQLVEGIKDGILGAMAAPFVWLKSIIVDPIISAIKGLFGIHSPSTVMRDEIGKNLIAGLFEGLEIGWPDIVGFFTDAWDGIVSFLDDTWEGIKTKAGEVFGNIKDSIGEAWENVKTNASETWNNVKETVGNVWDNMKTSASETFENIKTSITDNWKEANENSNSTWDTIKNFVGGVWDDLTGKADTDFESMKESVTTAWNESNENSNTNWSAISDFVGEKWNNLKDWASEKFGSIKDSVVNNWNEANTSSNSTWEKISSFVGGVWTDLTTWASDKFNSISNTVKEKWGETETNSEKSWSKNQNIVTNALSEIGKSISDKLSNLASEALTWGADICKGIGDGIKNGVKWVSNAVSSVAQGIRDFIGFSEPDKGPLSNFHTYMPDMMQLMADGIRENTNLPLKEVRSFADTMSDTFQDIKSPQELGFASHENAYVQYQADYSNMDQNRNYTATQDVNESITADMRNANSDVVNALYTITNQIVTAIQENAESGGTYLDGKLLTASVEKYQRQRGTTIMSGGVL